VVSVGLKRVLQKGQGTRVDNVSEWRVDALVRKTVQSWVVFLTPSVLTLNPSEKLFANEGILSPPVVYPLVPVVCSDHRAGVLLDEERN
jgi:hypothetical protein